MLSNRLLLARVSRRPASSLLLRPRSPRPFQSLASSTKSPIGLRPPWIVRSHNINNDDHEFSLKDQQIRWKGRKSGASALDPKPRRWSKKQKKRFQQKLSKERDLQKHSPPGSKAGKRREYVAETHDALIEEYRERLDGTYYAKKMAANPLDDVEYTQDDALLDDVVGNAGHWTSQPTIEPVYTGHRQRAFYNQVMDQMELYQETLQSLPSGATPPLHLLPEDKDVGAAVRAYRDRHGTRNAPIGLARALEHVLKELRIPSTSAFGEYTYNALLSCCRTPTEAVRVFQLMQQNGHQISAYSWSILIDVHSKVGDFEGCVRAMDEMIAEGHAPNLPAYTSLLAACYKVCNNGRIAHSVRSRAWEVGWEKWQELRIIGLDPDVMCYGAILRLCAARGQPERALNLLEEMPRFDVQPTTLCFSSALKAVAKSHETAIRYERGWSKKNKRRERIAAHHGKLARNIVLLAESAGVEQDDGFISALQLCAAAAGDSATTKAIYMAAQVRQSMKHLRQVGSDEHLQRLLGDDDDADKRIEYAQQQLQLTGGSYNGSNALAMRQVYKGQPRSYGEREYGKDTRTLTAILKACASAADTSMVGEMWSGRENDGYLDLTSLRLIQERRNPSYRNTDIPGMSRTEAGVNQLVSLEDMENPRKRNDPDLQKSKRRKFPGMVTVEDGGTNLDDLSDDMYYMFHDKETGMLKQEYIDSGDYPEYEAYQQNEAYLKAEADARKLSSSPSLEQIEAGGGDNSMTKPETESEQEVVWYFDEDTRRWGTRPKQVTTQVDMSKYMSKPNISDNIQVDSEENEVEWYFDDDIRKWCTRPKAFIAADNDNSADNPSESLTVHANRSTDGGEGNASEEEMEEEWYFDEDIRRWKTRMKPKKKLEATPVQSRGQSSEPSLTDFEAKALQSIENDTELSDFEFTPEDEADFEVFYGQLKQEVAESGGDMDVDEDEARELFVMMKNEFSEEDLEALTETSEQEEEPDFDAVSKSVEEDNEALPTIARGRSSGDKNFQDIMDELKDEWGIDDIDEDEMDPDNPDYPARAKSKALNDDLSSSLPSQSVNVTENVMSAFPENGGAQLSQEMLNPSQATAMLYQGQAKSHLEGRLKEHHSESHLQRVDEKMPEELVGDVELQQLQQLLPGFPLSRLKGVRRAYEESLADPSMLTLVPLMREKMPDVLTSLSMRANNFRTAEFVFRKAQKEGLVDGHILNGMLQVHTAAGSLDNAMEAYEQFEKYKMKPTSYSDRLMIQMFIKNQRFSKALAFKQRLEEQGRKLDLLAYGPIIDYCSRHGQVGSALMVLKECIAVNGAPPGEHYLKELRTLCRQYELEDKVGLTDIIGEDPLEWLRHGEAVLKRERSYRGNRDLNLLKNAGVRA